MWCNIECCCGVISVCLPTLGPLIQRIFQRKFFGYDEVSRVTSVTRIELQSRTSDYSKDELSPGTQPPWERIELEPYSHAVIASEHRWMSTFNGRKSGSDEPLSTWAVNIEQSLRNHRPRVLRTRSVSVPEFPDLRAMAHRTP